MLVHLFHSADVYVTYHDAKNSHLPSVPLPEPLISSIAASKMLLWVALRKSLTSWSQEVSIKLVVLRYKQLIEILLICLSLMFINLLVVWKEDRCRISSPVLACWKPLSPPATCPGSKPRGGTWPSLSERSNPAVTLPTPSFPQTCRS